MATGVLHIISLNYITHFLIDFDVASDVGVNFKNVGSSLLKVLYFTYSIIHFYKLNIKEKVINYILH